MVLKSRARRSGSGSSYLEDLVDLLGPGPIAYMGAPLHSAHLPLRDAAGRSSVRIENLTRALDCKGSFRWSLEDMWRIPSSWHRDLSSYVVPEVQNQKTKEEGLRLAAAAGQNRTTRLNKPT
ncbi:hypothetical protein FKP32DRAFT_920565 [Trametes sanguinea]|nr:hypothetical protein FKP32DRAFT_920565 [Trametes sanguinea]